MLSIDTPVWNWHWGVGDIDLMTQGDYLYSPESEGS